MIDEIGEEIFFNLDSKMKNFLALHTFYEVNDVFKYYLQTQKYYLWTKKCFLEGEFSQMEKVRKLFPQIANQFLAQVILNCLFWSFFIYTFFKEIKGIEKMN